MTSEQKRALRLLYFFYTPYVLKKPDDVERDPDWMKLTDDRNTRYGETRDKLWGIIRPLTGITADAKTGTGARHAASLSSASSKIKSSAARKPSKRG